MNKVEFLRELDRSLSGMQTAERKEILADYEEHFQMALADGQTEEEISASLGHPRAIAKSYKAESLVEKAGKDRSPGNILRAVLAVVSLSFFNLVFVAGIFAGLIGVLAGIWAAVGSMALAGLAVFLAALVSPLFPWIMPEISSMAMIGAVLAGAGLAALGALGCIGAYYVTRWFYKLAVGYLKFNIKIIKG